MSDDLTIAYMSEAADARGTIKKMQKRIDELEAHTDWLERHCLELMLLDSPTLDTLNERTQYLVNHSSPLSLTLIQRKAMLRCVEICENMADTLQSSDCTDCANAIKLEILRLSDG